MENDSHSKDVMGKPIIHDTQIYRLFAKWSEDASLDRAFVASVSHLDEANKLDLSILHGDGSTTVAKKGGDLIGYSGHKHQSGQKTLAIVDNQGYVLAPMMVAPVNRSDMVLFPDGMKDLRRIAKTPGLVLSGAILNLDSGFDSKQNRKHIFNAGMKPTIKENPRHRKTTNRGRKRLFDTEVYALDWGLLFLRGDMVHFLRSKIIRYKQMEAKNVPSRNYRPNAGQIARNHPRIS